MTAGHPLPYFIFHELRPTATLLWKMAAAFQYAMELDTAIMGGQSTLKRLRSDDVDDQRWSRRKQYEFGEASQELPADL